MTSLGACGGPQLYFRVLSALEEVGRVYILPGRESGDDPSILVSQFIDAVLPFRN